MRITRRTALFAGTLTLTLLVGLYMVVNLVTNASGIQPVVHFQSSQGLQNNPFEVTLEGFTPGETVTLWQTYPDYKVLPRRNVQVDSEGKATVSLFMDSSIPVGQHALSARGNTSGVTSVSTFSLAAPEPEIVRNHVEIVTTQSGQKQGNAYTFQGSGYDPSEPVALWLTLPDGSVRDLKIVHAGEGEFTFSFTPSIQDPIGTYHLTGFGRSSQRTAVTSFSVEAADNLAEAEDATLEIWPPQVRQLEVVTLTGRGFNAGEVVGLWITLPDGSVVSLYEGVTVTGAFQENIYLPAVIPEGGLPAGHHKFSAYGKTSGKRAITSLELLPGEGE